MKAKELLALLAVKHSADVFVPECKNGPTHGSSHLRMDAWSMRRSWTAPQITGYEIKVTRADFLGDKKWPSYLPYCHYFSFVVAPGVCEPSEVPENCGLLIASKNGSRLFTKRKPLYREVVIPENLWMYILICRSTIKDESLWHERNLEYWRDWLGKKQEGREIGWRVSSALRKQVTNNIEAVKRQNEVLEKRMKGYDKIAQMCEQIGVSPHSYLSAHELKEKLAFPKIPQEVERLCGRIVSQSHRLGQLMKEIRDKQEATGESA